MTDTAGSDRRRPRQRRGVRAEDGLGEGGSLANGPTGGVAGGDGDLAGGADPMTERAMTTDDLPTATKIETCRRLIADLEEGLAEAEDAARRAKADRAAVALAAAEGDVPARKSLDAATTAGLKAGLDAENIGLAIATARERLAGLEAVAEAEAKEAERQRIIGVCGVRLALARAIDQTLANLEHQISQWRGFGGELHNLRRGRWREMLGDQDYLAGAHVVLQRALPPSVVRAFGAETRFHASEYKPLVEIDPASWTMWWLENGQMGAEPEPEPEEAEAA